MDLSMLSMFGRTGVP